MANKKVDRKVVAKPYKRPERVAKDQARPKIAFSVEQSTRKEFNKSIFENLCKKQCTQKEIAGVFGVCEETIRKWVKENYFDENQQPMSFMDVWKDLSSAGLAELRCIQFEQAQKVPTMAIWLGKQYLGQCDRVENNDIERVVFVNDIPTEEE